MVKLKLKLVARRAEKQIPTEPHWAFCYSMLHKVSRSFVLVIQQLDTDFRDALNSSSMRVKKQAKPFKNKKSVKV
ncbi:UNVERIFIED_CONTAM: Squalene synthase 10 [Sesamum indicum]